MEWQFWRAATVSRRWRNVTHGQVRKSLLAVKHTTIQAGFKHFNQNCDIWQLSSRWDTWKLCQKYHNSSLYNVGMPPSIITGQKWCLADPGGTSLYCIIASGDHPCLKMPSSSTHFFRVFRIAQIWFYIMWSLWLMYNNVRWWGRAVFRTAVILWREKALKPKRK